jgi:hypothetical protein
VLFTPCRLPSMSGYTVSHIILTSDRNCISSTVSVKIKIKMMVKLPALRAHALLPISLITKYRLMCRHDALSVHHCVNPIKCTETVFMSAIFSIYSVGREVVYITSAYCFYGYGALLAPCYTTVDSIAKQHVRLRRAFRTTPGCRL